MIVYVLSSAFYLSQNRTLIQTLIYLCQTLMEIFNLQLKAVVVMKKIKGNHSSLYLECLRLQFDKIQKFCIVLLPKITFLPPLFITPRRFAQNTNVCAFNDFA